MTPEEYRNQDVRHQDQKFYTAFCLLGSACNDYAVGVDLRREQKLNWAATALYYSLVHCGRLACFVAKGDFPTGHEQLKQLFETEVVELRQNGQSWIGHFRRHLGSGASAIQPQLHFRQDDLLTYFANTGEDANNLRATFSRWGQLLSKAKKLREDSNYEGLLISHEHNHVVVTEALHRLVRRFSDAAETVLPKTILLMKRFLDSSGRGEPWYAFLNWREERQGPYYLEALLQSRVNDGTVLDGIEDFLSPLRQIADQHKPLARGVLDNVKIGVFTGKTSLMDAFQNKIQEFESIAL